MLPAQISKVYWGRLGLVGFWGGALLLFIATALLGAEVEYIVHEVPRGSRAAEAEAQLREHMDALDKKEKEQLKELEEARKALAEEKEMEDALKQQLKAAQSSAAAESFSLTELESAKQHAAEAETALRNSQDTAVAAEALLKKQLAAETSKEHALAAALEEEKEKELQLVEEVLAGASDDTFATDSTVEQHLSEAKQRLKSQPPQNLGQLLDLGTPAKQLGSVANASKTKETASAPTPPEAPAPAPGSR